MSLEWDDLQVFCGDANEHNVRVYVCSDRASQAGRFSLRGVIRGPFAIDSETLPARFQLNDLPGETLLAATVVTDPCFWTPLHPTTYEVEVEIFDGAEAVAVECRRLAIRPFGVRGRSVISQGKRRVLRLVAMPPGDLRESFDWLIETATTAVINRIDDTDFDAALDRGVRLIIDLTSTANIEEELRRIANAQAVIAVLLTAEQVDSLGRDPRALVRHSMFIADLRGDEKLPETLPPWALLGMISEPQAQRSGAKLPYAAIAAADSAGSPVDQRATVDGLQAALARKGQFAGYAALKKATD